MKFPVCNFLVIYFLFLVSKIRLSALFSRTHISYVEELLRRPVYKVFKLPDHMLILLTAETVSHELRFGSQHIVTGTSTKTAFTCYTVWNDNILLRRDARK
jgi:hypothetical protein